MKRQLTLEKRMSKLDKKDQQFEKVLKPKRKTFNHLNDLKVENNVMLEIQKEEE